MFIITQWSHICMGKTQISAKIPDYLAEDLFEQADNKTQRIIELLHKAEKYEMMEAMADRDAMQAFIKSMQAESENKKGSGPTGHCIYAVGSPLRFSSDFEELNPRTALSTTSARITD